LKLKLELYILSKVGVKVRVIFLSKVGKVGVAIFQFFKVGKVRVG
jgi:hypothetical protein